MKLSQSAKHIAMAAVGMVIASSVMAAPPPASPPPNWVMETITYSASVPNQGSITVPGQNGPVTYTFTTVGNINTAYYNANLPQGTTQLASELDASGMFGLQANTVLTAVGGANATSGTTLTVPGSPSFNLLGVHAGGAELLFAWNPTNTANFTISSSLNNLSDYRSYNAPMDQLVVTSSIPEPHTYIMMLAGLLAVGFMVRRRNGGGNVGNGSFAM